MAAVAAWLVWMVQGRQAWYSRNSINSTIGRRVALVAGKSIRSERCDCVHACCRGWKMTELFREAVYQLANHVAMALPVVPPVKEFGVAVIMKSVLRLIRCKHLDVP